MLPLSETESVGVSVLNGVPHLGIYLPYMKYYGKGETFCHNS